ncbi:hypothetical protein EOL73_05045 [Candidatus Saccharibacteria bacterium]|nr:hypothetical protein [Candidatus Saccharibacteria bacterium]
MTDVDPFVVEAVELLAAKDRIISALNHDVQTLVTALAVHEGGDVHYTALAHLGRTTIPYDCES